MAKSKVGVAGYGTTIENCSSMVGLADITACSGAIAGWADPESGGLTGNTFVHKSLGAVDGIVSEKPLWFFLERYMGSYQAEVREFIDCIINNKEPWVGIEDGLLSIKLALACIKSMQENRPVRIDEI